MSNSIGQEIEKQSQLISNGTYNFICKDCKNYMGSCVCLKGVFIAFEGANIPLCYFYKQGIKCPHCGRNI